MEYLKEYFEAWSSRVKSPVLGSIIVTYLVFNWKAFYYLLFAETSAAVRIRFFELNTSGWGSILYPIVFGIALAVALPWINLLGSIVALKPLQRSRDLQINESIRIKVQRLKAEADLSEQQARRERAIIDQERNLQVAEEVGGESLKRDIAESRSESMQLTIADDPTTASALAVLDDFTRAIILLLGDSDDGLRRDHIMENELIKKAMQREAPSYSQVRYQIRLNDALGTLTNQSIVLGGDPVRLTAIGYRVYDKIKSDIAL